MSSLRRQEQASESMSFPRWAEGGMESMLSEAVTIGFNFFVPPPIDSPLRTYPCWNDMGGWIHVFFRLKQASTAMSSLRRLVGEGMGSIAVEAVPIGFNFFAPPPIDSSQRTYPRRNDMGGWMERHGRLVGKPSSEKLSTPVEKNFSRFFGIPTPYYINVLSLHQ